MLRKSWKYGLAIACALALACQSGKAPAEAALKLAEEAVAKASDAASKLMPDELKAIAEFMRSAVVERLGDGVVDGSAVVPARRVSAGRSRVVRICEPRCARGLPQCYAARRTARAR